MPCDQFPQVLTDLRKPTYKNLSIPSDDKDRQHCNGFSPHFVQEPQHPCHRAAVMSFKKFKADVSTAAQKAASGGISGVLAVKNGDSDGEVVITYHHECLPADVRIQALAQDLSEYPDGNMFMVWTDDADPPTPVVDAIKAAQDYLLGMSVYEMVIELASRLEKEICGIVDGEGESPNEEDELSETDDYDAAYDADYPSDGDEFGLPSSAPRHKFTGLAVAPCPEPLLQRIRRDLRKVKHAGYKVGLLDSFGRTSATGTVSISIRIDKLALSDEAMEAWDVKPSEYVVLLLRFEKQYDPLEQIVHQAAAHTEVKFRIGKCNKYKPLLSQALHSFAESNRPVTQEEDADQKVGGEAGEPAKFEKLFISNSLDQFLCDSLVSLLKLREALGLSWEEANEFLLKRIGLLGDNHEPYDSSLPGETSGSGQILSDMGKGSKQHQAIGRDHLLDKDSASERSLPLVAMQFAMRHFVKCTEYCLRCHRRLEKGFEALRPYVCSDPLCLFQYMAMGFGPSIEHEILTEPYVVDLLVSLCYAAVQLDARQNAYAMAPSLGSTSQTLAIRSLPVGLRIRVPDLSNTTADVLKARVTVGNTRLVFEEEGTKLFGERLAPGKWLAFRKPGQSLAQHARIQEVKSASKTVLIEAMGVSSAYWGTGQYTSGPDPDGLVYQGSVSVEGGQKKADPEVADVYLYDADFDSLSEISKGNAMRHVLDTLPSILKIEEWLKSHPHSTLRSMDCVSPAAASLLQWIVSSNRSCIFQVDRSRAVAGRRPASGTTSPPTEPQVVTGAAGRGRDRERERILGMDGWIQFRFAQGSPDKELRFNQALKNAAASEPDIRLHPTIFAWHGSNLSCWHSIVRTGLDFKDIKCGRSYGNGVYLSAQHSTSIGYAGGGQTWPHSDLSFNTCLSLCEVINAPNQFVSNTPHYVVDKPDWIQCRYLFVQTAAGRLQQQRQSFSDQANKTATQARSNQTFYPQAPGREVYGPTGRPLQIPLSAIPLRTMGSPCTTPNAAKRAAESEEDSDSEEDEDEAILFSDGEIVSQAPPHKKSSSRASSADTATVRDKYVLSCIPLPSRPAARRIWGWMSQTPKKNRN